MRVRPRRFLVASAVALAATVLFAAPASATWSIDGVDPATGEVGVAVASCVPFDVSRVAVVVPGKGAGSVQANPNQRAGAPMAAAITAGRTPQQAVDSLTTTSFDPKAAERQFGVAVIGKGGAGWSGSGNSPVSLDRRNPAGTASAQGNILVSDKVVTDALAAFDRTDGPLAARLLAALEAGSAAGGDSRCGKQTASSAALVVARPGDPVWAYTDGPLVGDPSKGAPAPSTYVSVLKRRGAANAVTALASAYRGADPVGGRLRLRDVEPGSESVGVVVLVALGLVVLVVAVAVVLVLRRRRRRRAAAAGEAPADPVDAT